jgi:hypothetical protein
MRKKLTLLGFLLALTAAAIATGARNAEANTCGYVVCYPEPPNLTCCDWCCVDNQGHILWCSDAPTICRTNS